MTQTAAYLARHPRVAWALVAALGLGAAALAGWTDLRARETQQLSHLQTQAQRQSVEILSTTLAGTLMGAIGLIGLTDPDTKLEATTGRVTTEPRLSAMLAVVGQAFDAEGVFIVGGDGIVKSSWDRINKPSTGLDVGFRPYYKMAMRGQTTVYAAVSMARGDRSLYFAAPVYPGPARAPGGIGAVVGRTNLARVDRLLTHADGAALLLSPQGVVFASSRPGWTGFIDGTPDARRLQDIRSLKQFGALFEKDTPAPLPFRVQAGIQDIEGRRHAVVATPVQWNDPSGDWTLVLLEALDHTVPWQTSALRAAMAGVLVLLLGWMQLHLLRGRHARAQANLRLQDYAQQQDANVAYRSRLASLAIELQHCATLEALAQRFLAQARELGGGVGGVLYVCDAQAPHTLRCAGFAACAGLPPATLAPGEGLLGQCVSDRRTQLMATPPGQWQLRSGLGDTRPAGLLLAPLVIQDTVVGALELALLQWPDEAARHRLDELLSLLTHNVEILRRHLQVQTLAGDAAQMPPARP